MMPAAEPPRAYRPRLGFLGVGWIGKHRLDAIAGSGLADVAAIADPSATALAQARASVPDASVRTTLDDLLEAGLDGVVIATPSGLHATQTIAALDREIAVFCQKPLARTADEARAVVDAARRADRLLGVDLSYRHLSSATAVREVIQRGDIGEIFAAELTFHNAYGPDKSWCQDRALAGGGCLMDLGVHLVDLAFWMLDFPAARSARGRCFAGGRPLASLDQVEDFCDAHVELDSGASVRVCCSWRAHIGQGAIISARFHGTRGGAFIENVGGSFYNFVAGVNTGGSQRLIASDVEGWGGAAAIAWVRALGSGAGFNRDAERFVEVSSVLDLIYTS